MVVTWEIVGETPVIQQSGSKSLVICHVALIQFNPLLCKPHTTSKMSAHSLDSYIIHLPTLQVVVCRFCGIGVLPKDPLDHYGRHHTSSKEYPIPMEIRHKIAAYMKTLDLCDPKEIIPPERRIPQIKIIEEGWMCKFPDCHKCATTEPSIRTHYYTHRNPIPNGFKNWEETSLQTIFDGQHKKWAGLILG